MSKFPAKYFVLGTLALITGCRTATGPINQNPVTFTSLSNNPLSARTLQGWEAHVRQARADGPLQKDCDPFYKLAHGKAKGSVMLFHGYSACPQQYQELAATLSASGYNVFAPLLPGHGKEPVMVKGELKDQSDGLPMEKDSDIYKKFAGTISGILKDEPGIKVAGGLSVGGVIAAQALIQHPDIYTSGVLLAPFFNAAGPSNILIPVIDAVAPNKEISWGKSCKTTEREAGRAGYCNFKMTHLSAVRRFGMDTMKELHKIKVPVQISGVENDRAASNSVIGKARQAISGSKGCFFPKGANHSMLSRYDNVGKNMFWLNPLISQFARFVDTGKPFDTAGKSEYGMDLCRS